MTLTFRFSVSSFSKCRFQSNLLPLTYFYVFAPQRYRRSCLAFSAIDETKLLNFSFSAGGIKWKCTAAGLFLFFHYLLASPVSSKSFLLTHRLLVWGTSANLALRNLWITFYRRNSAAKAPVLFRSAIFTSERVLPHARDFLKRGIWPRLKNNSCRCAGKQTAGGLFRLRIKTQSSTMPPRWENN